MAPIDEDIDRLYQLPLSEFTAERNALAKRAGPRGAEIKQLAKPSLPAWAVNQLYWRRRKAFDRVMKEAGRLRDVHRKLLSGARADLREAETAHREAVRAASDEIRALLEQASERATDATMAAVGETLQALPGAEPPGRLTQPLRPGGFEALAGMLPAGGGARKVVAFTPREGPAPLKLQARKDDAAVRRESDAAAKRDEARRRQEAAKLARDFERARQAARAHEAALDKARRQLEQAEAERRRAQERLADAAERVERARDDVRRHQREADEAVAEVARLERLAPGTGRV